MLSKFLRNGKLPKAFTSSFVSLYGKTKNPQSLNEFRPISLIACNIKIKAKVLASRTKGVLPGIITSSQIDFIQGRLFLDGVLVANEVVNIAKKKKWPLYMFKVDFEKTYDSVSWSYLEYMLRRMGFNDKWRSWMKACVFSGSISVLVNGSPTL